MISADTTVVISVVFYSVYRTVVDTNQNASWILVFPPLTVSQLLHFTSTHCSVQYIYSSHSINIIQISEATTLPQSSTKTTTAT